jgi:maltose alpha-D-glucosyltransferase/alpha-amylase
MGGRISGVPSRALLSSQTDIAEPKSPPTPRFEQSNSSIVFGRQMILKLFRRVEPGINPDVEMGRYLSEQMGFPHTPMFLGTLEYEPAQGETTSLAILQRFVPSQGDAWTYTLAARPAYRSIPCVRPPPRGANRRPARRARLIPPRSGLFARAV